MQDLIGAYDKDLLYYDLHRATTADEQGRIEVVYSDKGFNELVEDMPAIYHVRKPVSVIGSSEDTWLCLHH